MINRESTQMNSNIKWLTMKNAVIMVFGPIKGSKELALIRVD